MSLDTVKPSSPTHSQSASLAEGLINDVHFLELPHIKANEKGQARWLEKMNELKKILQNILTRLEAFRETLM